MTQKLGHMLTQKPLKMEALMVETKQKLTKGEKRRAEREYKEEKNSGLSNGRQGGGRGIMQRASYFAQSTNFRHVVVYFLYFIKHKFLCFTRVL